MKSVDEHIGSIGARAEDCASQGWDLQAPASGVAVGDEIGRDSNHGAENV